MLSARDLKGPRTRIRPADAVPYLVSDLAVIRALQTHYARRALPADRLRAARLVALVASARVAGVDLDRASAPWAVEFSLDAAATAPGLRMQVRQVEEAIRCLCDAGVLAAVRTAGTVRYRLAEEVYERSGAADALDWPAVFSRLDGEPAAMLVARALVDLLPALPGEWGSVPLSALGEHTGYGAITARKGKDVLVRTGILEEDLQAGHTSRFRFSDFARGGAAADALRTAAPQTTPPAPAPAPAEPEAPVPPNARATLGVPAAVPLRVGGLELRVPPGTSIRMEVDAAGRPTIHVGDHLVIGPL